MAQEKEVKDGKDYNSVMKKLRQLEARVERMQENWRKFSTQRLGCDAPGGRIKGHARLGFVLALATVCLMAGLFAMADVDFESGDKTHWGTAAVRANGDYDTEGGIVSEGTSTFAVVTVTTLSLTTITASNVTVQGTITGNVISNAGPATVGTLVVNGRTIGVGAVYSGGVTGTSFSAAAGLIVSSNQTVNGVIAGHGNGTIDNTGDPNYLSLTETHVKVAGIFTNTTTAELNTLNVHGLVDFVRLITAASAQFSGSVTGAGFYAQADTIIGSNITANGVVTGHGGATIDNTADANVLSFNETIIFANGIFTNDATAELNAVNVHGLMDVVGKLTAVDALFSGGVTGASFSAIEGLGVFSNMTVNGVVSFANGAAIDNVAKAAELKFTETTLVWDGNSTNTGTMTVDGHTTLNLGLTAVDGEFSSAVSGTTFYASSDVLVDMKSGTLTTNAVSKTLISASGTISSGVLQVNYSPTNTFRIGTVPIVWATAASDGTNHLWYSATTLTGVLWHCSTDIAFSYAVHGETGQ